MKTREEHLKDFHTTFGLDVHSDPTVQLLKLRRTLIDEETKELFADIDTAISCLEAGKVSSAQTASPFTEQTGRC